MSITDADMIKIYFIFVFILCIKWEIMNIIKTVTCFTISLPQFCYIMRKSRTFLCELLK